MDKILTLKCNDGVEFSVKESVAVHSLMIKNMIKDDNIPSSNSTTTACIITSVDSETLSVVLEYLNKHADSAVSEEDKKKFDYEFVKEFEDPDLVFLLFAAYNLEVEDLMHLVAQTLAGKDEKVTAEGILQELGRNKE